MRRLTYVPIIHGPEDLGSRLEDVRKAYLARYGLRAWQQHLKSVEQFWEEVRHGVRRLSQGPSKLRVYQDGLPVCGRELELAQQLAANGSRNHRLIVELVEQGALLTGTEDPELLKREQERSQDAVGLSQPASACRYDTLMEQRDRYIAAQIDATLQAEGEVGLLFMGALHRVAGYLPKDIETVRLHGR